ncbi:MAG: APC family permease [Candidatus Micrarchaeia archaeon]
MAKLSLKKSLSLVDATAISLGAIIGAGVFVLLGNTIDLAGPAAMLSIVVGFFVAALTALSFSELSVFLPREGGAYEFAHELVGPFAGFVTGFLWLFSNIVACAVLALGFSSYLSALVPLPANAVAFAICCALTLVNLAEVKRVAALNNALVGVKLLTLFFFVVVGLLSFNVSRFTPFAPNGLPGVLTGAAIFFFAFGGFARITTASQEVKNARENVPKAILFSLGISFVLYFAVAVVAVGLSRPGMSTSSGFLAQEISSTGISGAFEVVSIGALAAIASVLLTTILGASRVLYAMARNREAPQILFEVSSTRVPSKAVLFVGLVAGIISLSGDLFFVASVSSFAMLAYYGAANYSVLKLRHTRLPKLVPLLGLLSCAVLALSLPVQSIILGLAATFTAAVFYYCSCARKR